MATDLGVKVTTEGKYYFISYNTEDADIVSRYVHALDRKGLPMWYDKGILVGVEWKKVIAEKIRGCEAVIMFISSNIFKKKESYVYKEWDIAKRREKNIILILLDEIDESKIPPCYDFWWSDISSTQSVSALKYGFETCTDMIIEAVGYVVENEMAQINIADGSDVNMKKNVNHDIPVEDNIDSASANNRESNVAEFVDQSAADDFVIEDGVLKKYKGKSSVVRIPYGVTSIGKKAFYYCKTLTIIEIHNSVTSIGSSAFSGCSALTSVVIGKKVSSICDNAFKNCYKLVEVINKSSLEINKGSEDYGYAGYYAFEIHQGKSKIVNQDGYLFYTYNGVNYLLGYAGDDTALTLPESYNGQDYSIYKYAFRGNCSITNVVIGKKVSSIGDSAFGGCYKLVEVINKSSLNIARNSNYGFAGYYALEVHKGESKIVNQDGYLFYTYNGVNYLLGYTGDDTALTLPESYNGQDYSIYKYAFYFNNSITSVVIPDSVTSIGSDAFNFCSTLTSVVIGNSVTSIGFSAFASCDALTSIVIPNSVTSIGDYAFYSCDALTSIVIPNSVKSIGDYAFCSCDALTSIVIPNSVKSIGDYAFCSCDALTSVVIGKKVSSIGDNTFKDCYKLVEVINKSLLVIIKNSPYRGYAGKYALEIHKGDSKIVNQDGYLFYTYNGVNYLLGYTGDDTALTLPENYNGQDYSIYKYAFCGNRSITSVVIPNSVKSIGDSAFRDCSALTSIKIPNSVTSIGDSAFYSCSALTSIKIPNSVKSIGSYVFQGCSALTSIVIPNSVKSIGDLAFCSCSALTSIKIPNSVTSIGSHAFYSCSALTSIEIPDRVTSISSYAFRDCSALTSIVIPDRVTSIGSYAFFACPALTSIVYRGTEKEWNNISFGVDWISKDSKHTLRFEPKNS